MNRFHFSALVVCCLALAPVLHAQDTTASPSKKKGIEVRLLATGLLDKADEVVVRSADGEGQSEPVLLPTSNLSDPVAVAKRSLVLSLPPEGDQEFGRTVGKVQLPQTGRRFLLLLVPAKEKQSYRIRVVRLDDPAFRPGHVCFFNLSPVLVGGELGKRKFSVAPGKLAFATPPAQRDLPYYQVRFFYKTKNQTRIFADTRWPFDDRARSYVIFFAKGQRITYHSIDEVVPKGKKN